MTTTLEFEDKDSGQVGFATVRVEGAVVGLALSLLDDGDIEVFLDKHGAAQLAAALIEASTSVGG
jgi:hypothetical protein